MKHGEVERFAQDHTAIKWQSKSSTLSSGMCSGYVLLSCEPPKCGLCPGLFISGGSSGPHKTGPQVCCSPSSFGAQSTIWKGKAIFRSGGKGWKFSSYRGAFWLNKCANVKSWAPSTRCAGSTLTLGNSYVYLNVCVSEVKWKSLGHVWLFVTPWTIVHRILQYRILEWVALPFFRGSSQPRDWTQVSRITGGFFTIWATQEVQEYWSG